jgi:PAT family beta-lactamase induction signal transducer AmpG
MKKEWWSLLALLVLGMVGGIFFEAGDTLIRLWARDMGMTPTKLDILNAIEILHPLKFLWAPIFSLALVWGPWQQRRAWLLIAILASIGAMGGLIVSPFFGIFFCLFLGLLTVTRASYDALVIASQMDAVSKSYWGFSENICVTGYRIGIMVVLQAALHASANGTSWPHIYLWVGGLALLSFVLIGWGRMFHFLNTIAPPKTERLWDSLRQWLTLRGSWFVLLFLFVYRLQDGLIDPQREYFLLDAGLSKINLAHLKTIALGGTIMGGFCAGACIRYWGYRAALGWGLALHASAAALLYMTSTHHFPLLGLKTAYITEQTTKGFTTIAIFSFQLLCCSGQNQISQLALFSAISDMGLKLCATRSGWIAEHYGWPVLMGSGILCGLPALLLLPFIFSKTFITDKSPNKTQ